MEGATPLTVAAYVGAAPVAIGMAMFASVLMVFRHLLGSLGRSKLRGEELHRLAITDELTGLANREQFHERLQRQIRRSRETGEPFAVMLIDLDRFKEISDTLGNHYGDGLLRKLGPRLARTIAPHGLIARLAGDEFAVITTRAGLEQEALERIAIELCACVQEPIIVEELPLMVQASVGISRFPADGPDARALMHGADVAAHAARETHSHCRLYARDLDRQSTGRRSVVADFRRALAGGEIAVYFQPIVDLAARCVRAAEALVRWEHPERGLIGPSTFIRGVEQTGLIGPLTLFVLERSIAQCASWRAAGRDLSVAVNLSVRNLLDPDLPADIERLLSRYQLSPEGLQLEITESMLMSDPDRALAIVTRLSELGVTVSVDDFGTGYSSLATLRRLPIDELKIDRSFVSPMLTDESDLIIVRSTINLGHDLGMRVIAEGVEDAETLRQLADLGCDLAQGFHLSRPMPPASFNAWLDDQGTQRALGAAV